MKLVYSYALVAIIGLSSRSAMTQAAALDCFRRNLDSAVRISACSQTITQGGLPDETRALMLGSRGAAHADAGDASAALTDYDAALALVPEDVSARLSRARLREKLGQLKGAETDYSFVIDHAPRTQEVPLGEAFALRGALRLRLGNTSAGIADLGVARRFDPRNPMPFKVRGRHFFENGEFENAAAELEQAANLNAGDIEVQIMLGSVQLRRGQSEAAVRAFSTALIVEPDNAEAVRGRATAYGQRQNYAAAITDYTAALNINGEDTAALEGRGVALLRLGVFASAAEDFDKLLAITPENDSAIFFRANARFQSGNPRGAVADFSAVLARRPGDGDALLGRGVAYQFAGDYDSAEADFTAVLKTVPDAAQPLANRGYVRVMSGAFAAAAEDLRAAMSLPNAPKLLALWRFIAEKRAGNPNSESLKFAMRGLDPKQWPAPLMRYFLGEASGSEIISAAIETPGNANGRLCETYFFLGQAALVLGDKIEAERLFNAAVDTGAVRFTEYAGAKAELSRLADTGE